MNKHVHRLIFDRRRGMRVPAAEHVRGAGKAASGEAPAQAPVIAACAVLAITAGMALAPPAFAQQRTMAASMQRAATQAASRTINRLPVLSTDSARTAGNYGTYTVDDPLAIGGSTMTINQSSRQAIINWDSFDVAKGYTVKFVQPSNGAALNNIWSNDPSVILGNIQANGEVILQNQNGIIFGPTARIDTGRFVATALSMADKTFKDGLRANLSGGVIFGSDEQTNQGFITIERGAEIKALAGGDVIMVAPKVYNEGRIETPSGQTVLAAGQKVYLYSSSDPAQRGLIVAVDPFTNLDGAPADINTVEQAAAATYKTVHGETVSADTPASTAGLETKINQVLANSGQINLVGMTVRQNGVLSATTAVKGLNGAIYLQAQKSTYQANDTSGPRQGKELGAVELGEGSITSVTPSSSADTQYSAETFYRSSIDISGQDVRVRSGALVQAVSGNIQIRAADDAQNSVLFGGSDASNDSSSLVIEAGSKITAAGLRGVELPMSRNQLTAQLFQIDLAESPVQRNGVVYRQSVYADARRQVTLGDVTGYYNLIGRTAQELSTRGGNIVLASLGKTVVADGAVLDISGGSVVYQAGQIASSMLTSTQGVVSIEDADPNTRYSGLISPNLSSTSQATTASYVEGADAGYLGVLGSTVYLGATINADAVVGPLQRSGAVFGSYVTAASTASSYTVLPTISAELGWSKTLLSSPWLYASLQPVGGTVSVGAVDGYAIDQKITQIDVVSQTGRAVTQVPETGSDAVAAFYAGLGSTELSSKVLQSSHLSKLILSGQQVNVAEGVDLDLGAAGALSVAATKGIVIGGSVRAEGGHVSLTAIDSDATVALTDAAVLDVSGHQGDERAKSGTGAVKVDAFKGDNAYSVDIKSGGSIDVRGAEIDVSGGYWLSGSTTIKGSAGSISLAVNYDQGVASARNGQLLLSGATLSGYDFSSGGTVRMVGMRSLSIGSVPAADQAMWADGLQLSADFFSTGGFGSFDLSALGHVSVMDNTQVTARLKNLYVPTSKRALAGTDASSTSVVTLEEGLRSGVSISLSASEKPDATTTADQNAFHAGSSITIGQGSTLDAGLGGAIALSAGRDIEVAGALRAHGGTVSLKLSGSRDGGSTVDGSTNTVGYIEDQEIRLKAGSEIDVSGAAKLVTTANGTRQTGTVLGGGTVKLNYTADTPARGRVVTEAGSLINVSGASQAINLNASQTKTLVSKGAGTVQIASADGFSLQGTFKAERPNATVAGGQFLASLSLEGKTDLVAASALSYPTDVKRNILLLATAQDVVDRAGSAGLAYGEGVLSAAQLLNAGFDRITLRSDDLITLGSGADLVARQGGTALRAVSLVSRNLAANDEQTHSVQAGYVSLGNKDLVTSSQTQEAAAATASAGQASLSVSAGLIDVYGYLGLQGLGSTNLLSTLAADQQSSQRQDGEIRLIGRTYGSSSSTIAGQLNFSGELTLQAGNTYTSTLSDYTLQGSSGTSTLTLLAPQSGSTSAAPLSALGHLSLNAHDIVLNGVVYQPFGGIAVAAEHDLTVGSQARVSVSGEGVTVPVGTTINGTQWVYSMTGTQSGVDATADTTKVLDDLNISKAISLSGANKLSLDAKAALSAQSGGDLQAWEFISGVGGSADVLDKSGYYAIVPSYKYDFAPFDTEVAATSKAISTAAGSAGLGVGDQVTITTANGVLAAGTDTLLPARYALLSGGVLVSSTSVAKGGTLAQAIVNDDGSVVVSGSVGSAGTALGSNSAGAALVLAPQATLLARSGFDLTGINGYLTAQAAANSRTATGLPSDAGRVSLVSNNAFNVKAQFDLAGGELDVSMGQKMAVVSGDASVPDGYAVVDADALSASKASSILIGGTREQAVGAATVTATASEVLWATSVSTGSELITVAKDLVKVADGVTLSNTAQASAAAQSITLSGQSAALMLSNKSNTTVVRKLSEADKLAVLTGTLKLGKNVTLAGNAVQLDAVKSVKLGDNTALQATSIGLGARGMLLGAISDDASVLSLTGDTLRALTSVQNLQLRSYTGIDFSGDQTIGSRDANGHAILQNLVIDAPQLRGVGSASDTVQITARSVTLRNSSDSSADVGAGLGSVVISAEPDLSDVKTGGLTVSSGVQRLAFQRATLNSLGDVILDGGGSLSSQGDLTVSAARLTATRAAKQSLSSDKTLSLARNAASHTLDESVGAGATVSLSGQRVVQGGVVDLAAGKLNMSGSGQYDSEGKLVAETVVFAADSLTSVAGRVSEAGSTWAVSSGGGDITATAMVGQIAVRGTLDVSAAASASTSDSSKSAGTLTLKATGDQGAVVLGTAARLKGSADTDTLSGKLVLDTKTLGSDAGASATSNGTLDRLVNLANAGQLHGGVNLRLREGNQSLDTMLTAVRAVIGVDDGSLTLSGRAVVDATAPQGGVVSLSASKDVILSSSTDEASAQKGAVIRADSSRAGANGGDVLLSSSTGSVIQQAGASVSAAGDADDTLDGRIVLRAGINAAANDDSDPLYLNRVKISLADASLLKAGDVSVEAVKTYSAGDGSNVLAYSRDLVTSGTITKKVVTKSGTKTLTTSTTGLGSQTTTVLYSLDADGNETILSQSTAYAFDEGATTKVTTATTASSVALATTYALANASAVVSLERGVTLNQVGSNNVAAAQIGVDADAFLANSQAIYSALGLDQVSLGKGHVRYGAEVVSKDNFNLLQDWNLAELHPGGEPIFLTVRAAGNINILGNLSDGFASATRAASTASAPTLLLAGDASSLRLVAGADVAAANVLATNDNAASGNLTIASGKLVRTTSGSIELAASGDVVLESTKGVTNPVQAVVYVAGRLSELQSSESDASEVGAWSQFTDHGGRMEVTAGGDITAPGMTQLIGNWLYHTGSVAGAEAWWTTFDSFKQGFGSFGGGNIQVTAGGSITNVGVVAPTSLRYINTLVSTDVTDEEGNVSTVTSVASTRKQLDNGGNVTVKAGGDILGGVYLLSRGEGLIEAGGQLTTGTAYDATKLAGQKAILGLMDGQWSVQTRGNLSLGQVYNPTILSTATARTGSTGLYYTYGADSAVLASSAAGDVSWDDSNALGLVSQATKTNWHNIYSPTSEQLTFSGYKQWQVLALVAPPVMSLQAQGGDLTVSIQAGKSVTMFPSATGDLSLYASADAKLNSINGTGDASLQMADTDPAAWPVLGNPLASSLSSSTAVVALPFEIAANSSSSLIQTGSTLHADDLVPARIHAGGNLTFSTVDTQAKTGSFLLNLPKPGEIDAGGNIVNPLVSVEHFNDQQVSSVVAGGNIEGGVRADNKGTFGIVIAGPGELNVQAGRSLNLNASNGVLSVGGVNNDALPETSAHLRLMAGADKGVVLDSFVAAFLDGKPTAQAQLIAEVRSVLKLDSASLSGDNAYTEALALFSDFSKAHQVAFADKLATQAFVSAFVSDGQAYAAGWKAAAAAADVALTAYDTPAFQRFKDEVLMAEVTRLGAEAIAIADSTDANVNAQRQLERNAIWAQVAQVTTLAGMGGGFTSHGNINLAASTVQTTGSGTRTTGGIDLFSPGGDVVVGLSSNDSRGQGIVTYNGGSIRAVLDGDFQVNSQKAFVVGRGDLTIYSVNGAIDSGRGSNTTVTAPPSTGKLVDGYMSFQQGAVTSGSGIGLLSLPDGTADGDINLFAPVGGILALDTFIRNQSGSGSVNLGGPVKGADNIKGGNVNGAAVAVAVGPALSTPSTLAPTAAGAEELGGGTRQKDDKSRGGILTVDLLGLGDGGEATAAGVPEALGVDLDCKSGSGTKPCQKRP
jgi:filamentous hemagglutinin